mgnify:CR=1 FL=1
MCSSDLYPVLLPQAGLPADSRAEHGFRNRGDAMNFSPLMLEQYVALAGSIVNHPELPQRSRVFAELVGESGASFSSRQNSKSITSRQSKNLELKLEPHFAPNTSSLKKAEGSADNVIERFRDDVAEAFREGRGGVFDSGDAIAGAPTVPGKGALLRLRYGDAGAKTLTVNPNEDIWLAAFALV